jgi:hypothetical protein
MHEFIPATRSETYLRAAMPNAVSNAWSTQFYATYTDPDKSGGYFFKTGITGENSWVAQYLFLQPLAEGTAGTQFSFRVWGWKYQFVLDGHPYRQYIPVFLAEFLCTVCNSPGPISQSPAVPPLAMGPAENFCDTIALTQGSVGPLGEIVSTGPNSDLPAFARLDLRGCPYFQFDFLQGDNIGMNCLFARG